MSNQATCPRCNGRLLGGAKNCLSCGALVAPGRSDAAAEANSSSIIPIIVVFLVVVGGALIFLFGAGASKSVDAVRNPAPVVHYDTW